MADAFEKLVKVSIKEYGNNPLYSVSLPRCTYQCALKYTDINLQTLQDEDFLLSLENNIKRGISSVMGDRYIVSNDIKTIL